MGGKIIIKSGSWKKWIIKNPGGPKKFILSTEPEQAYEFSSKEAALEQIKNSFSLPYYRSSPQLRLFWVEKEGKEVSLPFPKSWIKDR